MLCRRNQPIAEIRPLAAKRRNAQPIGLHEGAFTLGPAFFEPLPEELLAFLTEIRTRPPPIPVPGGDETRRKHEEDSAFVPAAEPADPPIIDTIAQRHPLAKPKEFGSNAHGSCPDTSIARLGRTVKPAFRESPGPHCYTLISFQPAFEWLAIMTDNAALSGPARMAKFPEPRFLPRRPESKMYCGWRIFHKVPATAR